MHDSSAFFRRCFLLGGAIAGIALGSRGITSASSDGLRIDEVLAGANGDSRVQFVELGRTDSPSAATPRDLRLLFFDTTGREVGQYRLPAAPPLSRKVLIATAEFAALKNAPRPDFVMPPLIAAISGKVCLAAQSREPQIPARRQCVTYGKFAGDAEGAGAAAEALPIVDTQSLTRRGSDGRSSDFVLSRRPSPTNGAQATFTMPVASLVAQGDALFHHETFQGNGRTCASCHVRTESFGLRNFTVSQRFEALLAQSTYDPLFIAETTRFDFNLNTLTLAAPPAPGDLRGVVRGATGQAKVLARTGPTTYLVYGGMSPLLTGTITDGTSSAVVAGIVAGDLNELEDPRLMTLGRFQNPGNPAIRRSLIKENIDGFDMPAVFRKSPHLLNLRFTAPYGFSGEFADLRTFSQGAIAQHFPRSLARVADVDFRAATDDELKALEAFQLSLESPAGDDPDKFNLDRFATTTEQRLGRELFFGPRAKCSKCHSGRLLNETDGTAGKPAGPATFNTGVTRSLANETDGLPPEPGRDGRPHGREFDIPSLFNDDRLPAFHEGLLSSAARVSVFYGAADFNESPGGRAVGGIDIARDPAARNALDAFTQSLRVRPYKLAGGPIIKFEDQLVGDGRGPVRTLVVTNHTTEVQFFASPACRITGPDAAQFTIVDCRVIGSLAPGESQTLTVAFAPTRPGAMQAVFEMRGFPPSGVDLLGIARSPERTQ